MLKLYVVALCAGVVVLIGVILTRSVRSRDDGGWFHRLRLPLGGVLGFAMGGIAAEYSPLDLSWPVALILALLGAAMGSAWVWYTTRSDVPRDDAP